MKNKKSSNNKQKKWCKFRHKVIVFIVWLVLMPFLKIRYRLVRGKDNKKLPKSCIIMCNHQAVMDPFFLSATLKRPIYYVMSQDVFTLGFLSSLIKYIVAPIPKSKSKSDLNTIRYTLKILGEGGAVGLFPSGNRTLSGEEWQIDKSASKLVKLAKVPLALYNIEGGYGVDPRWGGKIRKGRVKVGLKKLLTKEEIDNMSVDELHAVIVETLNVKDPLSNQKFKSKRKAEYLERALYYCPKCKSIGSLYSDKNILYCRNCEMKVEYGEDLRFNKICGDLSGDTVADWYNVQKDALKDYVRKTEGELFSDLGVEIRLIQGLERTKLGSASIKAYSDGVKIETLRGKVYDLKFSELISSTILGKRKINFYTDDETTVQVKGSERFNAIKYLNLYQIDRENKE